MAFKRENVHSQRALQRGKKKNLSWTLLFSEKVIKTKWKRWHLSRPVCILLSKTSTSYCGHWGRDNWIWSRFAGGCLTSVFISELSKGRKGLLLLFSCVQPTYFISSQRVLKRNLSKQELDTRPSHYWFCLFINRGFSTLATSWLKWKQRVTGDTVYNQALFI